MSEDQKKQLQRSLWNIANELRGKMNADEFRDYMLGFIFYKYLSEKIELYANGILQPDNLTYVELLNHPQQADYMQAVEKAAIDDIGYFLKPNELFHHVAINSATNDNLNEDLERIMNSIEQSTMGHDSEDDFEQLFSELDLNATRLGRTVSQRNELISKVLVHLDKIDFKLADSKVDILGDAYEYLISQFASGAGKKAGEFYTPQEDIRLLILAREFNTQSGPIDALGVDQNGNIYLIETKLYKNPDKRTVVAQVLDYGASLWSSSLNFTDFLLQLDKHVQAQFNMPTTEKLQEFFKLEDGDVDSLIDNMQKNLNSGIFKFVVLMDSLHKHLKDLIVFLNRNSQFDTYAVELEYYKHNQFEIIIPKMFGTEVKKDVVTNKSSSDTRRKWNETSYWQEVDAKLDNSKVQALRKLYDWSVANADEISWGTGITRGSFNPYFTRISPRSFITVYTDCSAQINYGYLPEDIDLRKRLRDTLARHVTLPGVTDIPDNKLDRYPSIQPDLIEGQVDAIIAGLTEFVVGSQ